ncbi:hypothetical protein Agabi119p4_9056 [Agaricus bisporus var. burnettii]|uniref:Uncharacterized protein n=1 Tax=Agaricus bisporus var. burnettii TaxID=192524 RepID=A0A8H7C5B6_AGABI|nr:hypothetical protein Agabi119p4_9056 [Agaricus bisporus var. burnettii]
MRCYVVPRRPVSGFLFTPAGTLLDLEAWTADTAGRNHVFLAQGPQSKLSLLIDHTFPSSSLCYHQSTAWSRMLLRGVDV